MSDIGGCEDLVENGVSGYRVQTENVSGYVEKIVELFENEKKRKDMGKKAANFVRENCDYGSVIWKLEKIVEELQNGDISLDESIKLFEKGIELTNDCRKTLETARQKITSLTEEEQKNGDK